MNTLIGPPAQNVKSIQISAFSNHITLQRISSFFPPKDMEKVIHAFFQGFNKNKM